MGDKVLREVKNPISDSLYGYHELFRRIITPELKEEAEGLEGAARREYLAKKLASPAADAYKFENSKSNGEESISFYMFIHYE